MDQGQPQQGLLSSFFTNNQKCQLMLVKTLSTSPYVKLLLDAMKHSGCAVNKDRHFSCEDCNGNVSGGFDASTSQIVLCQNNIRNQAHMNRVVTHELIHAFDHCRAHVDWFTNVRHLACSELGNTSHRFGAQDVASPVTGDLIISVIVIGSDGFHRLARAPLYLELTCVKATVVQFSCGPGAPIRPSPA
ncbi:Mitochondrial inner membrane protease ATP23 like protein [Tupaia chinensis]|uniref:Mitochondrial inner membrane protease ATP23 n=1 Tax=Tupaia chinensis TaxID=246437 RepID=L8Y2G0_TUPCH|nr:Mitochondrial inner membrane protease ATP23 like protein [Tupaia chinensis]